VNRPAIIPLWLKIAYSAFLAVLVPFYWVTYTPWNFLYFCDVALLITLVGLWTESRLLLSMAAVGISIPQILWLADFATLGHIVGMTSYMFNPEIPLFARGLSLFHGWLPILLWVCVWKLGYEPQAYVPQAVLSWLVLLASYFLAPAPPAPADNPNAAVNLNYVHGLKDDKPQTNMPPLAWLGMMMLIHPVGLYLPTHFALRKLFPVRR